MNLPTLKIGNLEAPLPIIQGGMAVRISLAPLAAAVANEGGIGLIAGSGLQCNELASHIVEARSLTDGIIGVNIMAALKNFSSLLETAIKEKIDLVVTGAGFSRDAFKRCREANIPFLPVVSSLKAAKLAEKLGATAIVVEGGEAGGHLGTNKSLFSILPEIISNIKIPVIAAGGIINGYDIAKVLNSDVKGVQIGTRFSLSKEASGADAWKKTCLEAKAKDIVIIESPVGMPFRAVFSPFIKALKEGKVPIPGKDTLVRCRQCLANCKKNYCIIEALERAQQGDVLKGLFTIGERVSEIKEVLSVKEIVANLVREFNEATSKVVKNCSDV